MTAEDIPANWTQQIILGDQVGIAQPPAWVMHSYATFRSNLLESKYPCYFGSDAERHGRLYYSYVCDGQFDRVPATIQTFLKSCTDLGRDKNNLAIFFEPRPEPLQHADYRTLFWDNLRYLREHDPAPPASYNSIDPSDPLWEFPFAGQLFFVVGISPSYQRRRSRNLGPGMIMVFQPRQVFYDQVTGRAISAESRQVIRDRVRQWDGIDAHPHLRIYGQPGNLEWAQYFISDDDTRENGYCPLSGASQRVRSRSTP